MSSMSDSEMHDMPGMGNDGSAHAMHSMEGRHMDMGPHMKMTTMRDLKPGDQEKADQVVEAARNVAEKYRDYKVALADGYKIFLPNLPQKQYHFTNYWYGFEASTRFNPEHPTSLLYEKQGDGYKLIGVMYTAPKTFTWAELDSRIPLSIAQWHAHVNSVRSSGRQEERDVGTESTIRFARFDYNQGSMRCRGRQVRAPDLRLDGSRLPVRTKAGRYLVSRTAGPQPHGLNSRQHP